VRAELTSRLTALGEGNAALLARSDDLTGEDGGEDAQTTAADPDVTRFTGNLSTIPSSDMSVPVLVPSNEPVGSDISPDDEGVQAIHGAGIVASSATDVISIEANVGASGGMAVSGSAGITMLEGTTRTVVDNTYINPSAVQNVPGVGSWTGSDRALSPGSPQFQNQPPSCAAASAFKGFAVQIPAVSGAQGRVLEAC
jgi:hypothetical protein